jgi:hypothetical protein
MARPEAGTTEQPRDLARMRQRLDDWRKVNARTVAFPAKLWTSAGRLAQRHGIYATARALGLEYNKLGSAAVLRCSAVRARGKRARRR